MSGNSNRGRGRRRTPQRNNIDAYVMLYDIRYQDARLEEIATALGLLDRHTITMLFPVLFASIDLQWKYKTRIDVKKLHHHHQ